MECGDLEGAGEAKSLLEEKQRKYLKSAGEGDYKPLWFDKVGDDWAWNGKYWTDPHPQHVAKLF